MAFIQYDPRYQTFQSWAALLCEQYAAQQLEIPDGGTDWKMWGNGLQAIGIFGNEAVPDTSVFDRWEDWAAALINTINSK